MRHVLLLEVCILILWCAGCSVQRSLRPSSPRSVQNDEVRVGLHRIKAEHGRLRVDIRVENRSARRIDVDPAAFRLLVDGVSALPQKEGPLLEVRTNDLGLSLILTPLFALGNGIAEAAARARRRLDPGEDQLFKIEFKLSPAKLTGGAVGGNRPRFSLIVDGALDLQTPRVAPLQINDPASPTHGFEPPGRPGMVFGLRFGLGAMGQPGGFGTVASVGLECFGGPQFDRFSVLAVLKFGEPLVLGADLRYVVLQHRRWLVAGFAGYGYHEYLLEEHDGVTPQGHGLRVGVDATSLRGEEELLGWPISSGGVGVYLHAGPAFLQDGPSWNIQAGFQAGFY